MAATGIRQFSITERGGAIFSVGCDVPEEQVFKSKVFSPDERLFLMENLRHYPLQFASEMTCHIFVRCLFHLEAQTVKKASDAGGLKQRHGNFVLFLHDFQKLTTSWCWMKLGLFLYQKGMDLIFMDLPGFGKSSVGENTRCPPSLWERFAGQVISHSLDELEILRTSVVAVGEGAGIALKFMAKYPHRLCKDHVFHNPIIREQDLNKYLRKEDMERIFKSHPRPNLWVTWDINTYGQPTHSHAVKGFDETRALLQEFAARKDFKGQISLAEVSRRDIAQMCIFESQEVGSEPVFSVIPKKYYRIYICSVLKGLKLPPYAPVLNAPGQYKWTLVPGHVTEDDKVVYGGMLEKDELEQKKADAKKGKRKSQEEEVQEIQNAANVSTVEMLKDKATEMEQARFYRKRESRLQNWHKIPVNPDLSYGSRIADITEGNDADKAKALSLEQFTKDYGEEEDEVERAKQFSVQTFDEEENDDRLVDLRSRPPQYEFEQLRDLQTTVEASLEWKDMYEQTTDADLERALEISRREVDLMSMLDPTRKAAVGNETIANDQTLEGSFSAVSTATIATK
jgi:pimeloyl-ACP methyl ester carboxylesterase